MLLVWSKLDGNAFKEENRIEMSVLKSVEEGLIWDIMDVMMVTS